MRLLVLSATASAINFINALGPRDDVELFVTDCSPYSCGLYREGVTPILVPRALDQDAYREAIEEVIGRHGIDALVPTSDRDGDGIQSLLASGWDPGVAMFRPDPATHALMRDKAKVMESLRKLGFQVPRAYSRDEELEFPLVLKPIDEGGSKGVWVIESAQELSARLPQVTAAYGDRIVLQEFVPGTTGSIYVALLLYDQNGQLRGRAASRSSLTWMSWGGGGNAGELVYEPELLDLAHRMVAALGGWRGPINLEFKRHSETGHFHLMEINCRLNGYSYLTTMNGLDFPAAIVDLLRQGSCAEITPRQGAGSNFILGFRERVLRNWIAPKSS